LDDTPSEPDASIVHSRSASPRTPFRLSPRNGDVAPQFDLFEAYDFQERVLGEGGYGTVRLARCRSTSREVAVKIVSKSAPMAHRCALHEAAIQKQLVHDRVCPLVDFFEDDENLYLVLEYIQGRDLFEEVLAEGAMCEAPTAAVIKQALEALQYCHTTARVIHRDLKPENVMLTRCNAAMQAKLVDFGLAIPIDVAMQAPQAVLGTELYLAPEARCGEYSPASDMWALGKVLCFMLFGRHLGDWQTAGWTGFSAEAQNFAAGLLCENVSNRFTAAQALEHPWLTAHALHTSAVSAYT
jgi:serine/threonine protein kinase